MDIQAITQVDSVTVEVITPERAAYYLSLSKGNRNERPQHIDALTREIQADRFFLTGDALVIDVNGALRNAHHRLRACVKANKPIPMIVIRGLSEDACAVLDSGIARTYSDILKFNRIPNYAARAAMASVIARLSDRKMYGRSAKPTQHDLDTAREKNEIGISAMLKISGIKIAGSKVSCAVLGALAFAYPIDPERVFAFAQKIKTGENLSKGDPALALRRRLFQEAAQGRDRAKPGFYLQSKAQSLLTLVALRAALEDQPLVIVKLPLEDVDQFARGGTIDYFIRRLAAVRASN
jgi:hypothetical protein